METSKRAQGCWTCKGRKIGCDRQLPSCNNCVRTGRTCGGYGIRLHWPDEPDGRRRLSRLPSQPITNPIIITPDYGKQFLNMTFADLEIAKSGLPLDKIAMIAAQRQPSRGLTPAPGLHKRESILMEYYVKRLSRMISTIDVNNGFRNDILPMALTASGKASEGLRNAILALSAYHLWGEDEALRFKHDAVSSLKSSIAESVSLTETQMATSMMLCVYNVFDETEGNWAIHLKGARNILYQLANMSGGRLTPNFLFTWFLYHEILGNFVQPLHHGKDGPVSLRFLRDPSFDKTVIIGSLGCSVEVMEIISFVNGLRAREMRVDKPTPEERKRRTEEWHDTERRLECLTQHLDPNDEEQLIQSEKVRIGNTAELYRVATVLYFHRTFDNAQTPQVRARYLEQAFEILGKMTVCTSPWPLFVIACETDDDSKRIRILRTLDDMDAVRHIGNIFVLRNIIESFWKHQDLQADSGRAPDALWWEVIDLETASPWFI